MGLRDWFNTPSPPEAPLAIRDGFRAVDPIATAPVPSSPRAQRFPDRVPLGGVRYGGFIEPEEGSPERWHRFLRYLRDHIPDVSAGVWAWVRLCSTQRSIDFLGGTGSGRDAARTAVAMLEQDLLESTFDHRPGFDGIVEQFFQSVFTVGAYAGEIVGRPDGRGLARFHPIDPATIRFRHYPSSGRMVPYQLTETGTLIPLNESSFFYFGLDADPSDPYGKSPLSSLPFVLRLQQQLFEDMGKAAHNAGYPALHVKYSAPEREPGESAADFRDRVQSEFESIAASMRTRSPESNFLTQDNVEIEYVGPSGQMLRWRETLETISEQVIAALHVAPFLIGRNYGTTQSWATAQYELMVNNAASVQRAAARLVDWIANLHLALSGSTVRACTRFAPHSRWNDVDEARAQSIRTRTLLDLRNTGLISDDQIRARLELE